MLKVKFVTILCLALSLAGIRHLYAQSEYVMAAVRLMEPANNLYGTPLASVGASLGYGKTFNNGHWGAEYTAFADNMNSSFEFATNKEFQAITFIAGLAITPTYCINPENESIRISGGISVKTGYNWGLTDIYLSGTGAAKDETLENKTANAGFTIAFAPEVIIGLINDDNRIRGLEFGYDTSSYGTGASKIKSAYFKPPGYNSGYLFIGIFLRL
jgi:hypothetical protein